MTMVTLTTVWLNWADDPSDCCSFTNMASLKVGTETTGEVRRLAGGRDRLVLRAGKQRTTAMTFPGCDRTQVDWLQDHAGELVCARDDRGRKLFGTYFAVEVDENRMYPAYADCSCTLQEVTHDEAY